MSESKWMTEKGITYATSLTEFANKYNMTNDEFLRGTDTSRSHHASGGNVETVGTMPDWAEGAGSPLESRNMGGEIGFEWSGGADNKRVRKSRPEFAEGGHIDTRKFKNFLNSLK